MRALFILLSFVFLARPALGQAACHGADHHSADVIYQITRMMDSRVDQAQTRGEFGIPLVSPSEITLVADSATCARAGQVVDSLLHVWNPTATIPAWQVPLYVFKIGTSYATMDRSTPNQPAYWVKFFTPLWGFTTILRIW
jgi:hypothetical protein